MSVAPDGSPIDLYLLLPPRGEAELVHENTAAGAEILELGAGVGRVTHELVRFGHPVVAVDESAEMLAHIRDATTVCARIEELDLGRRFPCVLLMSNLVNTEPDQRRAFLSASARHLDAGGILLIERHEPHWAPEETEPRPLGDLLVSLRGVRVDPPVISATVRYEFGARAWHHPFTAWVLDDDELAAELESVGLELLGTLDDAGCWVKAGLYSNA
jgi:SAM-dependent methyltransferase